LDLRRLAREGIRAARTWTILVALGLVTGAGFLGAFGERPARADGAPAFDDAFWKHWGDGRAEVASYDLTFPRYGVARAGVGVAIFVTETFSNQARVKADPGVHPVADEFPVMKLNLVQDFATGVYDYNLMTSVFTSLAAVGRRPAGTVAKVSFSSQEWCGHVYHQLLPSDRSVRSTSHSYFDGEADRHATLRLPRGGVFEDALLSWARGFVSPRLTAGESVAVPMLRSTESARLRHEPIAWETATLSRSASTRTIEAPAGSFEVETFTAAIAGDAPRTWRIFVEVAPPRRIIRWETTDGHVASLIAAERLKYWQMNGDEGKAQLERIGLRARGMRTP
jgi:hypothetical protein